MRNKGAVIEEWIRQKRMKAVDPVHLIFLIWSSTQHYADFETQVLMIMNRAGYEREMIDQIADFLSDRRLVHDEDLLLAVGFMQMVVEVIKGSGTYDPNEELVKDLAREELEKRLGAPLKMKDSNDF